MNQERFPMDDMVGGDDDVSSAKRGGGTEVARSNHVMTIFLTPRFGTFQTNPING